MGSCLFPNAACAESTGSVATCERGEADLPQRYKNQSEYNTSAAPLLQPVHAVPPPPALFVVFHMCFLQEILPELGRVSSFRSRWRIEQVVHFRTGSLVFNGCGGSIEQPELKIEFHFGEVADERSCSAFLLGLSVAMKSTYYSEVQPHGHE